MGGKQSRTAPPAKISRPRLRKVYERARLFQRLEELRSSAAIWIEGPAGAGKTTLVASYLDALELPCLWYQVDEGDEDVASFFYYLGLACQQATPRRRTPLPLWSPAKTRSLTNFSRDFFAELWSRLPGAAVLVFDNYQEAGQDSFLHQVIRAGIENTPENRRIMVVSRHCPPSSFARILANGGITAIGWNELQLTEDEAQNIVAMRRPAAISFGSWASRSQGWVAGLVLLIEWHARQKTETSPVGDFVPENVFNYFASELLQKAEPDVRDVLLKSALLPQMSARIVAALTENQRSEEILADLHGRNFFVTRHGAGVYQYHPLFHQFLLSKAKQTLPEHDLKRLRQRAAVLSQEEGQMEAAIELLRANEDWPGMAEVIKISAKELLAHGRAVTLSEWIRALPVRDDAWLDYWLGQALLGLDPRSSLTCFERALAAFRDGEDAAAVYLAWCGVIESVRFDWAGSQKRYDRWIALFDELQKEFPDFPGDSIELKVMQAIIVPTDWRMPTHPRRPYWRARMLELSEACGDVSLRVDALTRALGSHLMHGERPKAGILCAQLEQLLAGTVPAPYAHAAAYAYSAMHHLNVGRLSECRTTAQQGLELAGKTSFHAYDLHLLFFQGAAAVSQGDLKMSAENAMRMSAMPQAQASFGAHFYHQLLANQALRQHDFSTALAHSEECLRTAADTGFPFYESWGHITHALARFELDEKTAAANEIAEALTAVRSIGSRWLEWACLCAQAFFAFREGDREAGAEALTEAFALGRVQGTKAMPGWHEVSVVLAHEALKLGIEIEYAKDLIRALNLPPDESATESWPWPVKIYTLGQFSVFRDDKPVEFSRKTPRKPIALLKCIIAFGGREVPERKLTDALWPDEEGDAAHEALTVTLHRLRKLLGDHETVLVHDGRVSLNGRRCWIDAWAFEHKLVQAAASGNREDCASLAQKALALYRGVFLSTDTEEPWTLSTRERLRARFIQQTCGSAKRLENDGSWEHAADYYRRGLEADDLAEELYQGLMRCYQNLHRHAEGIAVYRRLRQTLSVILNIPPSPASEALYRSLRGE